jgi:hypothetical protein
LAAFEHLHAMADPYCRKAGGLLGLASSPIACRAQ